jgi:hypothetical protein
MNANKCLRVLRLEMFFAGQHAPSVVAFAIGHKGLVYCNHVYEF